MRPNILFFFSDQHRGDWMPYNAAVKAQQGVSRQPEEGPL